MQGLCQLPSRWVGRIWRSSHSVSRRTVARMDPAVRNALAENVAEEVHGTEDEWRELEQELVEARRLLQESEAKEQFLGMRLYKYQQKMKDQALHLKEEQDALRKREAQIVDERSLNDDDVEKAGTSRHAEERERLEYDQAAWNRRMVKWEEESDLLQSIQATHKTILVDCENMRRKIRSLEKRRIQFQGIHQECSSFVVKAATIRAEDHLNGESDSPSPEVELTPSVNDALPTQHPDRLVQGEEAALLHAPASEARTPV